MNKELEHDKKAILCLTEEFSKFVRESIAQGHLENFEDRKIRCNFLAKHYAKRSEISFNGI